jgi:hypothetical protein
MVAVDQRTRKSAWGVKSRQNDNQSVRQEQQQNAAGIKEAALSGGTEERRQASLFLSIAMRLDALEKAIDKRQEKRQHQKAAGVKAAVASDDDGELLHLLLKRIAALEEKLKKKAIGSDGEA